MPDNQTTKELGFFRSIAGVHDNPDRYKTVGHDGISEHLMLPGGIVYAVLADNPECLRSCPAIFDGRPTTTTREKPRKFTATTWLVLVLVLVGLAECIKSFASMVAYLWGIL